jgi:hypothetical protein
LDPIRTIVVPLLTAALVAQVDVVPFIVIVNTPLLVNLRTSVFHWRNSNHPLRAQEKPPGGGAGPFVVV